MAKFLTWLGVWGRLPAELQMLVAEFMTARGLSVLVWAWWHRDAKGIDVAFSDPRLLFRAEERRLWQEHSRPQRMLKHRIGPRLFGRLMSATDTEYNNWVKLRGLLSCDMPEVECARAWRILRGYVPARGDVALDEIMWELRRLEPSRFLRAVVASRGPDAIEELLRLSCRGRENNEETRKRLQYELQSARILLPELMEKLAA